MKIGAVLMHPIDHKQLQLLPGKTEESRGAGREEGVEGRGGEMRDRMKEGERPREILKRRLRQERRE